MPDTARRSSRTAAQDSGSTVTVRGADERTHCFADDRFSVYVHWRNQHGGGNGRGESVPADDGRSRYFWFFRPDNVELIVKILDGRAINGEYWVFHGALTDVGYEIEVLDTADGHAARRYVNPPGNLCGQADTAAF